MSSTIPVLSPDDSHCKVLQSLAPEDVEINWVDSTQSVERQAAELKNARLERAIRGWASREPQARRVQDRVDRKRLEFLVELCTERMKDPKAAALLARIFQLALVGAQHVDPPFEGEDLYGALRFLDPLFDLQE